MKLKKHHHINLDGFRIQRKSFKNNQQGHFVDDVMQYTNR